jgi:hypothetical protein
VISRYGEGIHEKYAARDLKQNTRCRNLSRGADFAVMSFMYH